MGHPALVGSRRPESIRVWRLLDTQFTEKSGHLTPALTLKRSLITRGFADQIGAIYTT